MGRKLTIQSKQLLLVEGKDEYNFFDAFLKHLQIEGIQIINVGGKDQFQNHYYILSTKTFSIPLIFLFNPRDS